MKSCSVTGCTNQYRAIGLCGTHWKTYKKFGSATPTCWCGELSYIDNSRGRTILCKTHALLERFWANVDVKNEDDCWEWQGAKTTAGYGVLYWHGENVYAHRISLEIDGRPVPPRYHACHTCDNPPCVNPKHLFVGSPRDNMRDKVSKGRQSKGESHYAAKLSDAEVAEIRRLAVDNAILADIAKQFNVSNNYVSSIVNNRRRI